MPFILVKSADGDILGLIRQTPQTKTTPPPWLATRPDENTSGVCPGFWGALAYLKRDQFAATFDTAEHEALSREMMAEKFGLVCHTLILGETT